jgi:hypothetical protein
MSRGFEPTAFRNLGYEVEERALLALIELDVVHRSTVDTRQMMVVARQPFGEFVARQALRSVVCGENTCVGQHRQRTVQRGQRHPSVDVVVYLRSGARSICQHEGRNHATSTGGVSDVRLGKPSSNLGIELLAAHPICAPDYKMSIVLNISIMILILGQS